MEADRADHFDMSRAVILEEPTFKPFYPERYLPLREALRQRDVQVNQRLLVAEIGSHVLALDLHQMSYHHVAQGELAGVLWLVSF